MGVAAALGAIQGGRGQGAGQAPPQCGGGQFVGQRAVAGEGVGEQGGDVGAGAGGGSRWVASRGQYGSVVMWGSMRSARRASVAAPGLAAVQGGVEAGG